MSHTEGEQNNPEDAHDVISGWEQLTERAVGNQIGKALESGIPSS